RLERFLVFLERRVIHQDVEPAERLERPLDRFGAEFRITDVAGNEQAATSLELHRGLGLQRVVLLFREIDDRHIGAFPREQHGDRAPDARITTGNERDLVLQLAGRVVMGRLVARLRNYPLFDAGALLMLGGEWRTGTAGGSMSLGLLP